MFHTVGYSASQSTGSVLTIVAALADQSVRIGTANDIVVPRGRNFLLGVYAMGTATLLRAQLQAASLRRVWQEEVSPIDLAALPSATRPRWMTLISDPIPLQEDENLEAFVADSGAAVRDYVFVWLGDGAVKPVNGEIHTVRATGTATLTANAWSAAALTFDQTLPKGRYSLQGARCRTATGIAFRFVFVDTPVRPGGICVNAIGDIGEYFFRFGNMGEWGQFDFNLPPQVEVLASAADTAETLELDLMRIG